MPRDMLEKLAATTGVATSYRGADGKQHAVPRPTVETVVRALGFEASTDESAKLSLQRIQRRQREEMLTPVDVRRLAPGKVDLHLRLPVPWRGKVEWHCAVHREDGGVETCEGTSSTATGVIVSLKALPLGYHDVKVRASCAGDDRTGSQQLIIVPPSCWLPRGTLSGSGKLGVTANLYSVRSERNWGCGDLSDLAQLARWAARHGGAFVGVNPLHAIRPTVEECSPYSPVSRLFRNWLYLDPAQTPEARGLRIDVEGLDRLVAAAEIDYEGVAEAKLDVLRELYKIFRERHEAGRTARGRAFVRYVAEHGRALDDFAIFSALDVHFGSASRGGGWQSWPPEFREPGSVAVARFARLYADDVQFHRFLQFETDRQLAQAAAGGRRAGLSIGLYQDLALGSSIGGSDRWSLPGLFCDGVAVGAPPDAYSTDGQDWGFAPLNPRSLRRTGYWFWSRLLRSSFAYSGALRIDHILGLFRQYWIPRGEPARSGTYVRFPTEDLLGVLALESTRAQALVIGEDLGTVPAEVPSTLERWGILSSKVVYFERTNIGAFKPSTSYPKRALASANTHDLAPLAGWRAGVDLEMRRRTGAIADDEALAAALAARRGEVARLTTLLVREGLLPHGGASIDDAAFRDAVHSFLRRTPCALVSFALDDLGAETTPVNLPSVKQARHRSWSRKMTRTLSKIDPPKVR